MEQTRVTVRIPATTANLGPGFDCLGMALDLWNEVTVEMGKAPAVVVRGQGARELPGNQENLVYRAMRSLFQRAHTEMPDLSLLCHNEIPLKRGLGSSAAAIVGGLVAANCLLSELSPPVVGTLTREELLDLAVDLEGHPDNVAAAMLGGLQLIAREEGALLSTPIAVPDDIWAVLYIPEMTIATEDARAVLPASISREDAVYNMGRVAMLVNALATGRLDDLRYATQDRLHQPYRQALFPPMKVIFTAAMSAGALGVFLSGSGSTILALTKGREMTVAYEMAEAARQANVPGEVKITRPSPRGAYLVENATPGTEAAVHIT